MIQLVEALRLSPGDSALDTGLLDLLRQGQATVGANEPAGRVAWLATKYDIEVVIVVNDDGIPVGLFIPSIVTERLPQTMDKLQQSSPQLQYTIAHLTEENNLPGAIIALEGEHNQYRSERFSQLNIQAFLCEDHGDPAKYHHIFRPSCTKHPGAKVRKIP